MRELGRIPAKVLGWICNIVLGRFQEIGLHFVESFNEEVSAWMSALWAGLDSIVTGNDPSGAAYPARKAAAYLSIGAFLAQLLRVRFI